MIIDVVPVRDLAAESDYVFGGSHCLSVADGKVVIACLLFLIVMLRVESHKTNLRKLRK